MLMRRLAESGDRAAAVATYESLRAVLQRAHGMAPSSETRSLAEQLRAERPAVELPLPAALAPGAHAPLVGREEPLAELRAAWQRASAGAAAVVTTEGQPGSGKTRLLAELAAAAHADGGIVLVGRSMEDSVVAFAPFTEALRPYAAGAAESLPAWVVAELARLLPELEPDVPVSEGEPQDARHRLFEAVAAAIGHATRQAPVLLIVDDLQWADHATLGMLAHTIRTVGAAPLLVAASLRDEGHDPALQTLLADLQRDRRLERVALSGLSTEETAALAGTWLDEPASPALAEAIQRRTGGNPLFVEELVRHLVESHADQSAEALAIAAGADVPEGVRSLIERRLARLPELAGEALRLAVARTSRWLRSRRAAIRAWKRSPTRSTRRWPPAWSTKEPSPGATALLMSSYAKRCWRG